MRYNITNLAGLSAFAALLAAPAMAAPPAAEERLDFIKANTLWIFYHELGHAIIDQMELPVLGKEEDAADQLAILLSDTVWDDQTSALISTHVAAAFRAADATATEPFPWWEEHAADLQRYFSVACLYYGGDPDGRAELPERAGLPPERAELCIAERALMEASWGGFLAEMEDLPGGYAPQFADESDGAAPQIAALLAGELAEMSQVIRFPEPLRVLFAPCGEENAFYDPDLSEIQICTEYADFMGRLYDASRAGDAP
ncbi:MAG: DUF4344 domain-containing metallopeptidase [Paracoccus sp. (in: a-proteobacteria)]|nr:DUF4344 domain-containing metallopeptidase [Paracoccus sp. (in: a-proteobacteria)]